MLIFPRQDRFGRPQPAVEANPVGQSTTKPHRNPSTSKKEFHGDRVDDVLVMRVRPKLLKDPERARLA